MEAGDAFRQPDGLGVHFFSSLTIRYEILISNKDWHIDTTIDEKKDQVFHYQFLSFSIRDDEPNPTGRSSLSLTSFLV